MITFLNIKRDNLFLTIIIIGLVLTFIAFGLLYFTVPDPQIFNKKVEGIFIENDFTKQTEIKLLEVLAQSGSLFENSVALYSKIIFTLFFVILTVHFQTSAAVVSAPQIHSRLSPRDGRSGKLCGSRVPHRELAAAVSIAPTRDAP